MGIFDIILIMGISITILLLILIMVSIVQFVKISVQWNALDKDRPKSKRKRKNRKKELEALEIKKSKKIRLILFSFLGMVIIGGGTGYAKYYQSTTISEQDIDNIVYGYYLLEQMEEQIKKVADNSDKKGSENIHTLAVSLSSFASKKGSDRSTVEAQVLLNQYYSKIGQFGVNVSSQNFGELKKSKEKQTEYLNDIEAVKKSQKKVIDFYKIDEASLQGKK